MLDNLCEGRPVIPNDGQAAILDASGRQAVDEQVTESPGAQWRALEFLVFRIQGVIWRMILIPNRLAHLTR